MIKQVLLLKACITFIIYRNLITLNKIARIHCVSTSEDQSFLTAVQWIIQCCVQDKVWDMRYEIWDMRYNKLAEMATQTLNETETSIIQINF